MEEEIKKAYMDWSEKGVSYLNCMYVYDGCGRGTADL